MRRSHYWLKSHFDKTLLVQLRLILTLDNNNICASGLKWTVDNKIGAFRNL